MKKNYLSRDVEQRSSYASYFVLGILAFCIFSFTIVKKNFDKAIQLRQSIKEKSASLTRLNVKIDYLRSLDRTALLERVAKVESVFPSEKPVMNLINSLKNVALENQVSVGGVTLNPGIIGKTKKKTDSKPNNITEKTRLQQFTLSITIHGTTENVFRYIDRLNRTSPLVTIDSLSLQSFSRDIQDLVSAVINVTVFFQAPPESIGSLDSPIQILTAEDLSVYDQLKEYVIYPSIQPRVGTANFNDNFFTPK